MTVRFRPSTPEPAAPPTVGSGRRFRIRWDAVAGQLLVGLMLAVLAIWAVSMIAEPDPADVTPAVVNEDLPPCETEDSTGCYWDADTRGNGEGDDVVTLRDGVAEVMP